VGQEAGTGAIEEAVKILEGASQPILLLGQGALASRAHADVAALAKKLECPIVYAPSIEAVLEGFEDRSFPYGWDAATAIVAEADAVVAIGTELGEQLHYGRGNHWAKGKTDRKWIYIERDPTAIGVHRPIDVPLVGDLRAIVPQLTKALANVTRSAPAGFADWGRAQAAQKKALADALPQASQPIHPGRLAQEAFKAVPEDAVLVRDGGASSMWFAGLMQFTPRDAMWSSNYGAVGTGLPYAVGAALADPKRPVVLVTGDSSMLFHIAELETAARKNLPIVSIVAVDNAWGIEIASYRANLGPDTPAPEARWNPQVRFDKAAESFGCHGEYVDKVEDIAPAVARAFASGKTAVVHVVIDKDANQNFAGIPGFSEFRTWYGEEGDNLGLPGAGASAPKSSDASTKGSGY
jgi:thiamine pyrophosphate-dependent acetolactate synthase large subunit-like protein